MRYLPISVSAPLIFGALLARAGADATPGSVPLRDLKKCADIGAVVPRVACYDRLAGREPAPSGTTQPAAAPAASPEQSFGLYSAEHPASARPVSLTATVIAIGGGGSEHPVITLEGNQVWELDGAEPLLKSGDTVTIKRGALGSFIMRTAAGRLHRLHRVR
jgi:hypothetical protein